MAVIVERLKEKNDKLFNCGIIAVSKERNQKEIERADQYNPEKI